METHSVAKMGFQAEGGRQVVSGGNRERAIRVFTALYAQMTVGMGSPMFSNPLKHNMTFKLKTKYNN